MLTTVPFKSVPGLDAPVADVMHRGVVALPAIATITDAAAAMRDNNVHAVLVIDTDVSPLGWVTRRGILHNHALEWTTEAIAVAAITHDAASGNTRRRDERLRRYGRKPHLGRALDGC